MRTETRSEQRQYEIGLVNCVPRSTQLGLREFPAELDAYMSKLGEPYHMKGAGTAGTTGDATRILKTPVVAVPWALLAFFGVA